MVYPLQINNQGRAALANETQYVRQLIEQVLFVSPGERVNRQDFGSDIRQLVFEPNDSELATAHQFMIQGALQQWLNGIIQVEEVQIETRDAVMTVTVHYISHKTQQRRTEEFTQAIT